MKLTQWRGLVARDAVPTIERRRLIPKALPADVKLLLSARELLRHSDLMKLVDQLLEIFIPTVALIDGLAAVERRADVYRIRTMARQNRVIPSRIRAQVLAKANQLFSVIPS